MNRLKNLLSKQWEEFWKNLGPAIEVPTCEREVYWEIFATAIGIPKAVARSCEMLSPGMLAAGFKHPDLIISERVEALAAWDENLLTQLATTWDSPWKRTSLFAIDAWRASLRFLKRKEVVNREFVETPELMEEVNILWDEKYLGKIHWNQALEILCQSRFFLYNLVRRMSRRWQLATPFPTLDEILEGPPWLLPMLRGHANSLNDQAKQFLLWAAEECLQGDLKPQSYTLYKETYDETGKTISVYRVPKGFRPLKETPLKGNLSDAPHIIEICREFAPYSVEKLADLLADKIESVPNLKSVARLVFLLTTQWQLP